MERQSNDSAVLQGRDQEVILSLFAKLRGPRDVETRRRSSLEVRAGLRLVLQAIPTRFHL
jgi:hypothetical protein